MSERVLPCVAAEVRWLVGGFRAGACSMCQLWRFWGGVRLFGRIYSSWCAGGGSGGLEGFLCEDAIPRAVVSVGGHLLSYQEGSDAEEPDPYK